MSYELTLIRPLEGEAPMAAYRRVVELAEMQRLANHLRARFPTLAQFKHAKPLPWIELTEGRLAVQALISEHSMTITLPYFPESAGAMLELAAQHVDVFGTEAGLVAYDPQLDRNVAASGADAMEPQYQSVEDLVKL